MTVEGKTTFGPPAFRLSRNIPCARDALVADTPLRVVGPIPVRNIEMAARTFTDSAGLTWDVFEVHRASRPVGAVSPGLEGGWLAFACGDNKRRLAPIPSAWQTSSDAELEALCESARRAQPPRFPAGRPPRPRIRPSVLDAEVVPQGEAAANVESTVRAYAHSARARGLPAVAAMLELKTLLLQRHPEPGSEASDRQLVRRWFVEAYYFERDQSGDRQS